MDLATIFDAVSAQMQSDFEKSRSALHHAGLKGSANEEIVVEFLRHYLPQNLEISSGIVVDSHGNESKQLDIIIHDASKTPVFYSSETSRVVPIECVYAAIEVKAFLDKKEIGKAFENMMSLKTLAKSSEAIFKEDSIIRHVKKIYGQEWELWPVQYYIFAFDSPTLESVLSNVCALQNGCPVFQRIDAGCILSRGALVNYTTDGMVQAYPDSGSKLVASATSKPLLFFYVLVSILLNQASMDSFNIRPYIGNIRF